MKKNESVTHASVMTLTNWCTSLLLAIRKRDRMPHGHHQFRRSKENSCMICHGGTVGISFEISLCVRKTHTYWVKSIYFKFHASWQPCIRLQIKKNSDAGNQTDFSYSCIAMLQIKKSFAVGAQRSPAGTPRDQWARRTRHWLHSLRLLGIPGIAASPFEFWSNCAI